MISDGLWTSLQSFRGYIDVQIGLICRSEGCLGVEILDEMQHHFGSSLVIFQYTKSASHPTLACYRARVPQVLFFHLF